jgi:hypothetical protein
VIFGNGAFLSASRTTATAVGRDYQIAVPTGAPLHLWLFSRHVTLADAQGKAFSRGGAAIPFQAAQGSDQSFTINVAGKLQ